MFQECILLSIPCFIFIIEEYELPKVLAAMFYKGIRTMKAEPLMTMRGFEMC
jgi:hypothetical protein